MIFSTVNPWLVLISSCKHNLVEVLLNKQLVNQRIKIEVAMTYHWLLCEVVLELVADFNSPCPPYLWTVSNRIYGDVFLNTIHVGAKMFPDSE